MRTIMTLVLVTLIGGSGAAQAQNPITPEEDAAKTEEATKDFLGLKWGVGIGVMGTFGGDGAVEKASIDANNIVRVDEEGDMRPQIFLEMHVFLNPRARQWRWYQRGKEAARMAQAMGVTRTPTMNASGNAVTPSTPTMPDPPLMGFGPFIALQSSDNKVVDALTVGVMWGARKAPKESASVNIGIGLSFDPSVQVLGGGLKEEDPLPANETAVRFKKEGRFGWALMTSFTF
jgi:hypothetical protein